MNKVLAPTLRLFKETTPIEKRPTPIKTRFKLEADFFDALLKRLEDERLKRSDTFRKMRRRQVGWFTTTEEKRVSFTNLSRDILSELIETAFWASLEQEEGRSLKFSIGYRCSVENEDSNNYLDNRNFVFQESKPFNVRNLVKLAPAIDETSSIIISPSDNKSLEIKGISLSGFMPLKITVLDSGKLLISYEMDNIAIISGSEVVFFRYSSIFINTHSIWLKLFPQEDKKEEKEARKSYLSFLDSRTTVVINILREMRKLGHGGAFIIVPCNKRYKKFIDQPIPYVSNELFAYGSETIQYVNEKKKEDKYYAGLELNNLAEKFAQLTAVDGVMLITRNLDLIGFGVKLKNSTKKKEQPAIYKMDSLDHDERVKRVNITELGNMRHQSAARFVLNYPEAVAFVVSQDGNVTAFNWMEDKEKGTGSLDAYSRLELVLF